MIDKDNLKFDKMSVFDNVKDIGFINFVDLKQVKNPVIFDTNFLFVTFQFNVDIISELKRLFGNAYSLFIYEGTLYELENLLNSKSKNKKYIRLIMSMLRIYGFKIIKSSQRYVDKDILDNLCEFVYIATNDKELKLKIHKNNYRTIYLRQKNFLEIY